MNKVGSQASIVSKQRRQFVISGKLDPSFEPAIDLLGIASLFQSFQHCITYFQ